MTTAAPIALADIHHNPTRRNTSGLDALDWVYGSTTRPDGRRSWGLPVGGVSLWAGAAGTGKSRMAVAVAARMSFQGQSILFAQNEVSPSQLRSWFSGQPHDASKVHILDSPDLDSLLDAMWASDYSLVVVDSISMLQGIERQVKARQAIAELKNAAATLRCHVVLVGHLNARGQVKGGTTLPHLVDTVAHLEPAGLSEWVQFGIKSKHRFGRTGRSMTLAHEAYGLQIVFSSDDQFPMQEVRFNAITGAAIRRVPIPGTGGQLIDVDEYGVPLPKPRHPSLLRRMLAG